MENLLKKLNKLKNVAKEIHLESESQLAVSMGNLDKLPNSKEKQAAENFYNRYKDLAEKKDVEGLNDLLLDVKGFAKM